MYRKTIVVLILSFAVALCVMQFSCSKTSATAERSKFDILTGNKWKVKALYFRDKNEPVSANVAAMYFTYKPCELDDIYSFNKDSIFLRTDSLVKCDPQDLDVFHINIFGPHSKSFWTADAGFTQMQIRLPVFYNYTWKILALNENKFEVEENKTDIFGGEHIYTYLFTPQNK